jgi:hypothetical protein
MAQLSAIKAMFHNDAKVLERLERMEMCQESTKQLVAEISRMLNPAHRPGSHQELGGASGDNLHRQNSCGNSCASVLGREPSCAGSEGLHDHHVGFSSARGSDQAGETAMERVVESLRRKSCLQLGMEGGLKAVAAGMGGGGSVQGSDTVCGVSVDPHRVEATRAKSALDHARADPSIMPFVRSVSDGGVWASAPAAQKPRPAPADALRQAAAPPLKVKLGLLVEMGQDGEEQRSSTSPGDAATAEAYHKPGAGSQAADPKPASQPVSCAPRVPGRRSPPVASPSWPGKREHPPGPSPPARQDNGICRTPPAAPPPAAPPTAAPPTSSVERTPPARDRVVVAQLVHWERPGDGA